MDFVVHHGSPWFTHHPPASSSRVPYFFFLRFFFGRPGFRPKAFEGSRASGSGLRMEGSFRAEQLQVPLHSIAEVSDPR